MGRGLRLSDDQEISVQGNRESGFIATKALRHKEKLDADFAD